MPYSSPGVYVEEVPPLARPIPGVGTSTAAFIGVVPDTLYKHSPEQILQEKVTATGTPSAFQLAKYPVDLTTGKYEIRVNDKVVTDATLTDDSTDKKVTIKFTTVPDAGTNVTVTYFWTNPTLTVFSEGELKKCTNFSQFAESFGDLSFSEKEDNSKPDDINRYLIQTVYGFFNNGGRTCYVLRRPTSSKLMSEISKDLQKLAEIDEIAIVAVPGIWDKTVQEAVLDHCENLKDRVAILDGQKTITNRNFTKQEIQKDTRDSSFGAIYFPWLKVSDPKYPNSDPLQYQKITVPPSGHIAGVYARVDSERGVFKAPANEVIRGALGLEYRLTKNDQDGLNPHGINVIRSFNDNIKIWGARTMGGDGNGEFQYISTRRFFNFLRESIDEGTQFAIFEPNNPALWQKIKRNVSDFLLVQWRAGALSGDTERQAFYVKCDAETNPPTEVALGKVIAEVGVSIVRPAEFVIFRISQTTLPS